MTQPDAGPPAGQEATVVKVIATRALSSPHASAGEGVVRPESTPPPYSPNLQLPGTQPILLFTKSFCSPLRTGGGAQGSHPDGRIRVEVLRFRLKRMTSRWSRSAPKSETSNPKPKPETRNPKPDTRNPKLKPRDPNPETRNQKPETRN